MFRTNGCAWLALVVLAACSGDEPAVVGGDSATSTTGASSGSSSTSLVDGSAATGGEPPSGSTSLPEATTSVDDGSTTCGFLCDGTGNFPYGECSLYAQDCPLGERCSPTDGWNRARCVPVSADPGQPGEPCTIEGDRYDGIDSCDVGALCWDVDETTGVGTCFAHCVGGSESTAICSDPNFGCWVGASGFPVLCMPQCDPLDPASCGPQEGCYAVDDGFQCAPSGPGGQLEPCQAVNDCQAGFACGRPSEVGACPEGASRCCTTLCDLTAPTCPPEFSCAPYPEYGPQPGFKTVGYCITPSK